MAIAVINGSEPIIDTIKQTQVYQVTHDGAGNRLPYMNRSFISFSYGGKWIEDFGLIAITDGDRLSHNLYANFNDNVSTSNIFDGQIHWGTHFKENAWDLTLSTDGMTEKQLDMFKQWFKPGIARELILAEHPNRGIMARISKVPVYSILPFEEQQSITLENDNYNTKTTSYRGNINISFIMDDPFWYALSNILNIKDQTGVYTEQWYDANHNSVNILESQDALKILAEDNIIILSMLPRNFNMLTGLGRIFVQDTSESTHGSLIGYALIDSGHIAYVFLDTTEGLTLGTSTVDDINGDTIVRPGYFYYGGTAPCAPIITFTLTPTLFEGYISSPCNIFATTNTKAYNTLVIKSENRKTFKFTTPSIYTAYNQVINIFKTIGENVAWEDVKKAIRNNVKHYAPREYAIYVIDNIRSTSTLTTTQLLNDAITAMMNFLYDSNNNISPISFTINCHTGETTAELSYRNISNSIVEIKENTGDMVFSNYLKIEDRNYPANTGYILNYTSEHPEYSHMIYADVANGLNNVNLQYKFLYL